jgi:hypothetical protein
MDLVLEVWREVCRHLDIHESVDRLMPEFAPELPVGALMIRRTDLAVPALETVACGWATNPPQKTSRKQSLTVRVWLVCSQGQCGGQGADQCRCFRGCQSG